MLVITRESQKRSIEYMACKITEERARAQIDLNKGTYLHWLGAGHDMCLAYASMSIADRGIIETIEAIDKLQEGGR